MRRERVGARNQERSAADARFDPHAIALEVDVGARVPCVNFREYTGAILGTYIPGARESVSKGLLNVGWIVGVELRDVGEDVIVGGDRRFVGVHNANVESIRVSW